MEVSLLHGLLNLSYMSARYIVLKAQIEEGRSLQAKFHTLSAWDVFECILTFIRLHNADEYP